LTRVTVRPRSGLIILMVVAHVHVARGQIVNGAILGTVRDATGGAMTAVAVTARSLESGSVRTASTDSAGAYQILSLPAGDYEVAASAPGFQTSIRNRVTVTVGASVAVNFELGLGEVRQEVTVSAEVPQVNLRDASLGGLVGEREVRELPLNGRDWLQLTTLDAGVKGGIGQQSAASYSNSRAARGNGLALSISGNRPTGNVFLVDGLVVNDFANASPGSGLNVNLGVEAVREFRVLTNEYTAEYGRSTGGVVTAIFKSGTNQFHGNVFEFVRNSALDARNFFDVEKPGFERYQFGGSAGGPITKNRTFIFGSTKALPTRQILSLPTPATASSAFQGATTRARQGPASRSPLASDRTWPSSRSRTARSRGTPRGSISQGSASALNDTAWERSTTTSPIGRCCGAAFKSMTPTNPSRIRTT
jgi:hypothetical protein